jgi:two-component system, LuxR family, response regulator FixJ
MDQGQIPWGGTYQDLKPAKEIFIVDDDEDMRDLLTAALAPEGFPVTAFEDGDSFLAAARTRVPICLFLDVVMPGRSGLEVLLQLRAVRFWTPIFLTSARDDFPTVVEAMKNGGHDFIRKPFDRGAPAARLHNAIESWSRRGQNNGLADHQTNETCEWFRLTPSEKEMVLLMRMVNS